jgi:hypothetical protein
VTIDFVRKLTAAVENHDASEAESIMHGAILFAEERLSAVLGHDLGAVKDKP